MTLHLECGDGLMVRIPLLPILVDFFLLQFLTVDMPAPRCSPMIAAKGNKAYFYGGFADYLLTGDSAYFSDMWEMDLSKFTYSRKFPRIFLHLL
jgi:hypothetical protein